MFRCLSHVQFHIQILASLLLCTYSNLFLPAHSECHFPKMNWSLLMYSEDQGRSLHLKNGAIRIIEWLIHHGTWFYHVAPLGLRRWVEKGWVSYFPRNQRPLWRLCRKKPHILQSVFHRTWSWNKPFPQISNKLAVKTGDKARQAYPPTSCSSQVRTNCILKIVRIGEQSVHIQNFFPNQTLLWLVVKLSPS